jgi:pre-mRNA-processing factor 17
MDLLPGYASSESDNDDEEEGGKQIQITRPGGIAKTSKIQDRRVLLNAAPMPSVLASVKANHAIDRLHAASNNALVTGSSYFSPNHPDKVSSGETIMLMNNPLKSQLMQPVQGPAILDPNGIQATKKKRGDESHIKENVAFDPLSFEEQRNEFQRSGQARAPDERGNLVVRGTYGHTRRRKNEQTGKYEFISEDQYQAEIRAKRKAWENEPEVEPPESVSHVENGDNNAKPIKRKRKEEELVQDSDDEINYGIWGPPTKDIIQLEKDRMTDLERAGGIETLLPDEIIAERAHLAERDRQRGIERDDRENQDFDKLVERKMSHLLPPRIEGEEAKAIEPSTTFHPSESEEYNYKGDSWIVPSSDFRESVDFGDVDHHKCYVPKKCVARFTGHNKGVHRIRLFPGTGHLLLSGGLDGKCKVWSVAEKKVMRTYIGHSAAVRDVQFNNDGTKFLSCSFDRFIRLWNTETGEVEGTYTNRRVPYIIKFYPLDNSLFVAGCSDNKIVTYDSKSGDIVQEYNHHLAPVNTITFVEDHGMKMITSSDDKKILVWEWDIGVPIKYISDPTMHSIPVITLHPSGSFFAGQSLDNQIVVYQGRDRFAIQRKKKFAGHQVSGYACDIAISPDGQFICSGDGNGKLFVWDWKRGRVLQKYHAHDKGPCIGCVWHPVLPSTVFTCGWDGVIKMWQ